MDPKKTESKPFGWFITLRRVGLAAHVLVLVLYGLTFTTPARAHDDDLIFGLVPALSPEHFAIRLQPLVNYLERETGRNIHLSGAPNYETFIRRLLTDRSYDFLISGADIYRIAQRRAGYRAIVRLSGPGVFAYIVTTTDSGITDAAALPAGVRVSTSGPLSFSRRLGIEKLRKLGVDTDNGIELVVTPTQNASLRALLSGLSDVAIFMSPVLNQVEPAVRERIHVLAKSDFAPSHPIYVRPDLPKDTAASLASALVKLSQHPDRTSILNPIGWPGFVLAEPSYFDGMDWAADQIELQLSLEPTD